MPITIGSGVQGFRGSGAGLTSISRGIQSSNQELWINLSLNEIQLLFYFLFLYDSMPLC